MVIVWYIVAGIAAVHMECMKFSPPDTGELSPQCPLYWPRALNPLAQSECMESLPEMCCTPPSPLQAPAG